MVKGKLRGVNDANYSVTKVVGGERVWTCPYYSRWATLISKCHYQSWWANGPTYEGCKLHEDWLTFSIFKGWMETQDWEGKDLDKDLLGDGKLYSPDTCAFIFPMTNRFIQNYRSRPSGVTKGSKNKPYRAQCNDPFTGKNINLGRFCSFDEAHRRFLLYKESISLKLSEIESDVRVKKSLLSLYKDGNYNEKY